MRRSISKIFVDGQPFDSVTKAGESGLVKAPSLRWKIQNIAYEDREFDLAGHSIVIVYKGEKIPDIKTKSAKAVERKPLMKKIETKQGVTDEDAQIVTDIKDGPVTRAEFRSLQGALVKSLIRLKNLLVELGEVKERLHDLENV
jgi:hypothetical protein